MPTYAAASIRNVAVVGHDGTGKTRSSPRCSSGGSHDPPGPCRRRTAPTDFDEEAIVRKHTLAATPAWLDWNGTKVNLVDTPGFGNFLSDGRHTASDRRRPRGRRRGGRCGSADRTRLGPGQR